MPRYRYQARDAFGRLHEGEQFASDLDMLRGMLADEHLQLAEAVVCPEAPVASPTLDTPGLVDGLLSVAEEYESGPIHRSFLHLANRLAEPLPLAEAVDGCDPPLPDDLRQIVKTAAMQDRLSEALLQALVDRDIGRDTSTRIRLSLIYPLGMFLFTTVLFVTGVVLIVPQFESMYRDFEMMLPAATRTLFWWHQFGVWYVAAVAVQVTLMLSLLPAIIGRGKSRRLLNAAPLVGVLFYWASGAAWARRVALMLEYGETLPNALRLLGGGAETDANVAEFCLDAAQRVESGQPLQLVMQQLPRLPATLRSFVDVRGELEPGRLRRGAELLEEMVRTKSKALHALLAPLVMLLIFCATIFGIISLFMPMVSLLNGLL